MGTYIIKQGNKIKLGTTADIANRLPVYDTHSAEDTELIFWNPSYDGTLLEKEFRKVYAEKRIRTTEWFLYSDELQQDMLRRISPIDLLANYNIEQDLLDTEAYSHTFDFDIITKNDKYYLHLHTRDIKGALATAVIECKNIIHTECQYGDHMFIIELPDKTIVSYISSDLSFYGTFRIGLYVSACSQEKIFKSITILKDNGEDHNEYYRKCTINKLIEKYL